jgi:hypothetical protein
MFSVFSEYANVALFKLALRSQPVPISIGLPTIIPNLSKTKGLL